MPWTAPRTWVAGETLSAALLNTHLRDNMLETEAAKATGGGLFFGAAVNSLIERKPKYAENTGISNTSAINYVGGTSTGPSVTTATSDRAVVFFSCNFSNDTATVRSAASIQVSGASAIPANDQWSISRGDAGVNQASQWMGFNFFFALTPGSNTFIMRYRVTNGASTGSFSNRRVLVIPM